jgi:hypothetical protein
MAGEMPAGVIRDQIRGKKVRLSEEREKGHQTSGPKGYMKGVIEIKKRVNSQENTGGYRKFGGF